MPYDQASFLAGVAAGRNMESWPADDGVEIFRFTVDITDISSAYKTPWMVFRGDIFWGDGTHSAFDNVPPDYSGYDERVRSQASHYYSLGGVYQIKLRGTLYDWATWRAAAIATYDYTLISIDSPFPTSMSIRENFQQLCRGAMSLVSLPQGLFSRCNAVSLRGAFYNCPSLTETPDKLLFGADTVTDLDLMFYRCTGLIALSPSMFAGAIKVERIVQIFSECSQLTTIPDGLFDPMQDLDLASGVFSRSGLSIVPDGIFVNNPNISSLASCFAYSALSHNPPPLWDRFPDANGTNCFAGCVNIPDYNLIPTEWGGP